MEVLLRAEEITKAYGSHAIFRDASFRIHPGDKIALVGPNGAGKTTLFKMLAGQLKPEMGEFEMKDGLRIEYLPQVPDIPADTPVSQILAAPTAVANQLRAELDVLEAWMGEPTAWEEPDAQDKMNRYTELQTRYAEEMAKGDALRNPLLGELGVPEEILDSTFGELSGGERSKVLLAKSLNAAKDMDLLLLDEPTNHMDIQTVEFIENYLMNLKASVVVSAHDQYLLDNVANKVFEVDHKKVFGYEGNYTSYLGQREAISKALEAKKRRDFNEVKRQLAIIEQLKSRNRFDSQVKSRKTRLAKQGQADGDVPSKRRGFRLFLDAEKTPREVLEVNGLSKVFGERKLFEGFNLEVEGDDKIGIIGANGTGKSTLLKMLLGLEEPTTGSIEWGKNCRVGYFDQHHSTLDSDRTLIDEIRSLRDPPPADDWSRGLLGRFKFSGDSVFKHVKDLSGGERARLSLAKFIANKHNVLVLDEPTNHLDMESQQIVGDALRDYEGSLIIVSHDRAFLDRVCNRIAVLAHKRIGVFQGNFSEAWTSKRMQEFMGQGIQGRFKVLKAFRDWTRDEKFLAGDVIEITGVETQEKRRMLRMAENNGWIEPMES